MTSVDFKTHLQRLVSTFGEKHFPEERRKMIWEEFRMLSVESWKALVDTCIRELKYAPTVKEMSALVAEMREVVRDKQRQIESAGVKDFWAGTYLPAEVQYIVSTIKARATGQMDDEEFKKFKQNLLETKK